MYCVECFYLYYLHFMRINILIIQYSAPSAWLSVRLCKWACPKITSGQTNLPLRRITAVDGWFNVIRQVTATCPLMRAHWRHLVNTIELVYPSAHSSPHPKQQMDRFSRFWATVCKTVRPMLSDRRPVCLSVCLWRWCIVAKRLDGSRWNLACR